MHLTLYHHEAGSTCSHKVRLCLRYKDLDYESINIDLGTRQNQSAAYLKINLHGVVPTLSHHGHVIQESNLIIEYLNRVFPTPPLLPDDPWLIYQTQYLCKRQEYINEQCLRYLSYQYSERVTLLSDADITHHSLLDRQRFLTTMKQGLSESMMADIEAYLAKELTYLNQQLHNHTWLVGKHYTMADLTWTSALYCLEQLGKLDILSIHDCQASLKWYERIKTMDHFFGYGF